MLAHVPTPPAVLAGVLLVAAIPLLALGLEVVALVVGGLGGILAIGVAFYTVGRSEDVDRERGDV